MPETRLQKLFFGVLMAITMVYGMEVYNAALRNGGLSNSLFFIPVKELAGLSVIVLALEAFVGGPLARRIAFRVVTPGKDRPTAVRLAVSVCTVCCMCPMMSLIATLLFKGVDREIVAKWLQTFACNLPMAFCWQMLVAGPFVRFAYGKVFTGRD